MGSLTALDILVLTLVGGSAVLGFTRGLVQEVTTLLAWILAIAAVRFFHPLVTDLLTGWVGSGGAAAMLAFVLLFGGVFAFAKWGSRAMGQRSRASLVGGFDRGLGAGWLSSTCSTSYDEMFSPRRRMASFSRSTKRK